MYFFSFLQGRCALSKISGASQRFCTAERAICLGLKEEYDTKVKRNKGKTRYDNKRKKHVPIKPNTKYVAEAMRSFNSDLTAQ